MNEEMKQKVSDVLEILRQAGQPRQSEQTVMNFDNDEDCSAEDYCEQAQKILNELYRLDRIRIAEQNYQDQFAPDGRDWDEV